MTGEKQVIAEAGRRGSDIRSDCWVEVTPTTSGGVQIELTSRVEQMYGDAIRKQIKGGLATLGLPQAKVKVEDAGALPFVLAARLEAAVRRLEHGVKEDFLPPFAKGTEYGTERDRFRRSRLYLPGNEPKFMLNAGLHQPDGVILDLEDSVAPPQKDAARILVRNALRTINFYGAERMVRINQGERGLTDLEFIVPHNVHVILIPKVESTHQVREVDEKIHEILKRKKINRQVFLMPIVESALGALRAYEIATASNEVVALTIGLEDYTADIGVPRTKKGKESEWARAQVVNAARAAGVQPIDTVFSDVGDMAGLKESVEEAKGLGFDGKGCIHPRQIQVIHAAFAPAPEELAKAQKIMNAFAEAKKKGLGVVSLGTKMIDPPVVKRAERVVQLAQAVGMTTEGNENG